MSETYDKLAQLRIPDDLRDELDLLADDVNKVRGLKASRSELGVIAIRNGIPKIREDLNLAKPTPHAHTTTNPGSRASAKQRHQRKAGRA